MDLTKQQIEQILSCNGDLTWLFHEGQEFIHEMLETFNETTEAVLLISRRFGKSYYACILSLMKCLQNPNFKVAIIAPSKEQASGIITPIFRDLLSRMPKHLAKFGKSTSTVFCNNGSFITVAGADSSGESIRGKGFDLVICEESGSWNRNEYEYNMKSVIRPTVLHSKEKIKILHTTTPSPKFFDHPLHTYTLKKNPSIVLTVHDNPLLTAEDIAKECEEQGGENSHSWRVEYLCEIIKNENVVVLPDFNKSCVYTEEVNDEFTVGCLDNGGTRDLTAYIEGVFNDDKIYVNFAQLFQTMTDVETKATFLKSRSYDKLICDYSGQTAIEFNKHGIYSLFPKKADLDVMITELNAAFRRGDILIHESLTDLVECLETATFNKNRTDFERTEKFGHADYIAAVNYLWRMKHLFTLNQKQRKRQSEIDEISYNNTSYLNALKKKYKEENEMQSLKFRRTK